MVNSFFLRRDPNSQETVSLHIWDLTNNVEYGTLDYPINEGMICDMTFHPLEVVLATITETGVIRIWELEKLKLLASSSINLASSTKLQQQLPKILFHNEATLFVSLPERVERFSWGDNILKPNDKISISFKNAPSHAQNVSSSSVMSLYIDGNNYLSVVLVDSRQIIDAQNIPNKDIQTAETKSNGDTHCSKTEISEQKKKFVSAGFLRSDRENSNAFNLLEFCSSLIPDTNANNIDDAKLISELIGDKQKKQMLILTQRSRTMKSANKLLRKADIQNLLVTLTKSKDLVENNCASLFIDSYASSMGVFQLTAENFAQLNLVISSLLTSGINAYMYSGLAGLQKILQVCSNNNALKKSKARLFKESIGHVRQLSISASSKKVKALAHCLYTSLQ